MQKIKKQVDKLRRKESTLKYHLDKLREQQLQLEQEKNDKQLYNVLKYKTCNDIASLVFEFANKKHKIEPRANKKHKIESRFEFDIINQDHISLAHIPIVHSKFSFNILNQDSVSLKTQKK